MRIAESVERPAHGPKYSKWAVAGPWSHSYQIIPRVFQYRKSIPYCIENSIFTILFYYSLQVSYCTCTAFASLVPILPSHAMSHRIASCSTGNAAWPSKASPRNDLVGHGLGRPGH